MTTYQNNITSDISSYFNTIYDAALLVARDNNIMSQLVTIPRTSMNEAESRKLSQFTGMTVNSMTDADDMASQGFTPSVISTLTPAMAGGQYWMTDQRIASSPFEERQQAAEDMGQAIATKFETDLVGSFANFTGGTVGQAGTVMSWSHVFAMETILRNQKAPYPYFLVLHPYQWYQLGKAASVAGTRTNAADSLLEAVNSQFFVRQAGGVYIFTSANISIDGSDDAVAGMFSRQAIALDIRRAPRLEPQRDASKGGGGWELNMTTNYAAGVWRKTFGVKMTADASVPTGS